MPTESDFLIDEAYESAQLISDDQYKEVMAKVDREALNQLPNQVVAIALADSRILASASTHEELLARLTSAYPDGIAHLTNYGPTTR